MKYFAYGSNLNENQLQHRCPNSQYLGKAHLDGYRLTFDLYSSNWGGGVADVVEDKNSKVWGLLYELTDEDLKSLDGYEGHPNFYKRRAVNVIDMKGKNVEAITYEVVNKKSFIPPADEYLDLIKKAAEKYNFPEDYKQFLDSINFAF